METEMSTSDTADTPVGVSLAFLEDRDLLQGRELSPGQAAALDVHGLLLQVQPGLLFQKDVVDIHHGHLQVRPTPGGEQWPAKGLKQQWVWTPHWREDAAFTRQCPPVADR